MNKTKNIRLSKTFRLFCFLFLILFSLLSNAQENCNNGIDDDGDGKIDLNDPDCNCGTSSITSIIPNPSFETYSGCSTSFSQLNVATPWIQATIATTDYYNDNCSFIAQSITANGLNTYPNGHGIVAALYLRDWNEYLGTTLLSPMNAGTNYQLTFKIAALTIHDNGSWSSVPISNFEPVNVTLYGCSNGANLPLSTVLSPNIADPTWFEIGHALYTPTASWGEITMTFTPSFNVNAIMIGSPPVLPISYPNGSSSSDFPYFLYDNLLLNTAAAFGVNISPTGIFCDNNLVLHANVSASVSTSATYQWYHNGIAIVGSTASVLSIPEFVTNLGNYSVKITDGTNCYLSSNYLVNNAISSPSYTTIQPNCITTTGTITITTAGNQYSFDGGATWQSSPTKNLLPVGTYYIKIKTPSGCISTATGVNIVQPQLLSGSNYAVTQPTTCNGTGSITITSSIAAQYSFDDGLTWTTNPTATNLVPGNYLIKIKDASGCQSASQHVIINRIYLASPTYTVVQPTCGVGGTISITTTAAEYSFDDGVTWSTNSVATNLSPGAYLIRIKNAAGCISNQSYIYLNIFYLSITPTYTAVQPTCGTGGTITITTNATEYSFDGGTTWSTNNVATNLLPGYYQIVIKNNLGCISQYQYVSLNQFYLANPTFTSTQPTCGVGGTITITTVADLYSFDGGTTWSTNNVATNLSPGTYYILIKSNLGCTSNYQYVNMNYFYLPDPTFVAVNPSCGNIGSITITTPAAQYSFDGGLTWGSSNVANNLTQGYYYIKIKNALGCESNYLYVYLDSTYLAAPNLTVVQPACNTNGSITINTVADLYSFDGGTTWGTNNIATNLTPGNYYYVLIKKTSGTGCQSNVVYVYMQPFYLPTPLYTVVQPTCGTGGTISITTVENQYSIDGGTTWTTNPIATNLAAGSYNLKVKNAQGCESYSEYVYLNQFYLPNPIFTETQPTCGAGGTITITTVSDFYSFDDGATWVTNPVATNLVAGYYYIKIKNALGCQSYSQYAYLYNYYLPNPTFNFTQPTCTMGGSITITTVSDFYSFDNGVTWTTNPVAINLAPNTYYIKIKNNLGCESNYQYVSLYQPFLPDPTYTVVQPTCSTGGSITITTVADFYSFDNGATWTTNPVATNLPSGYHYIKIKTALGCESYYQFVYINSAPSNPAAPTATSMQPTNCGSNDGTITVTTSAVSYSFDNGITWGTSNTVSNLYSGTYLIKVKYTGISCESLATAVTLNSSTVITAPVCTTVQPTCVLNTGSISVTTVAAQYSFDNGFSFSSLNTITNLAIGTYNVKIKDAAGCISTAAVVVISPYNNTEPTPVATSPQYFCIQNTNNLGDIVINGLNIKWYTSSSGGTILPNSITLSNNTKYYASQTISGCESTRIPVLILIQNTIAPTGNTTQTFCSSANPTLNSIALTGTGIKWYDNAVAGNLLPNATTLTNGTTYYATQNVNGCESTSRIVVTITIISSLPSNDYATTICDNLNDNNEIVDLSTYNPNLIASSATYTFEYYTTQNAAQNQIIANQITNFTTYNLGLGANYIYVRIISPIQCFQVQELKLITITSPVINLKDNYPLCQNKNIVVNATGGFNSYTWSTGSTSASISITQPGNYWVTVTKNHPTLGLICSSTKNFTVFLSNAPTITNIDTDDWTDIENIITVNISGTSIGNYEYSLDNIHYQSSNLFYGLESGIYTVYVRDINNCGDDKKNVFLLMYPKFFTPNSDGVNDNWGIKFSKYEKGLRTEIYDRYGKFITELSYNQIWDGNINGIQALSDDYWFVVTRADGTIHKGHFAIKR